MICHRVGVELPSVPDTCRITAERWPDCNHPSTLRRHVQALLIVWQLVVVTSRGLITPWIDMAVATDVRI